MATDARESEIRPLHRSAACCFARVQGYDHPNAMSTDPPTVPQAPAVLAEPTEPAQKVRVSHFVYLILGAILLYCASAGPGIALAVVAHRTLNQAAWVETAYITVYRPHLDLCYRNEGYFRYINWFRVKAGGVAKTHAEFKDSWEVEGGYRKSAVPAP